jgi:hypothetical protein
MKTFSFLLSSRILSASTALDIPEGVTRDFDINNILDDNLRDLQCEAGMGGIALPAQQWIDFLESFDGDDSDTLVDDLNEIIALGAEADFSPLIDRLRAVAQSNGVQNVLQIVRGVVLEIRSITDPAEAEADVTTFSIEDVVNKLHNVVDGIVGLPEQSSYIVIFIVIHGITDAFLTEGPIGVLQLLIEGVLAFLVGFSFDIIAINIFPNTDPKCTSDLMMCHYIQMMLTVGPGLLAGVFLALGEPAAP